MEQSVNGLYRERHKSLLFKSISSMNSFRDFPGGPLQEAQVQFLGQEDPMEKGMATKASILNCPQGCRV